MTRDELLEELRSLKAEEDDPKADHAHRDAEVWHIEADDALLEFIGDEEIEEAYLAIKRWHA